MKFFSLCGYGNALSFKNVVDDDIEYVEKHVREKLSRESKLKLKEIMKPIFGSEINADLSNFELRRGDAVLVKELALHVELTCIEHGPKYFTLDITKNEAKSSDLSETKAYFFLNKLLLAVERNAKRKKEGIDDVPPFCLLIFGTDNKQSAEDVSNRWKHITSELKKVGIEVITIASDSDPKYNTAMRKLSKLGQKTKYNWFSSDINDGPFYIQDLVHIATKLRNFLLRFSWTKHDLPFGKNFVRLQHLYELMDKVGKDRHFLTLSTLNPTDRQNYQLCRRMCSDQVINSDGTIQFLQIIRLVIDAFMEKILTPLQRIRKIWYALFLIRIWRRFIVSKKQYSIKNNFLTANCYSCIELNAHSLILIILHLKRINKPELFMPHLYDSQTCESTFRQFRSMTTAYSTITNRSMKEAMSRISNIQFQNDIMHITSPDCVYPRLKKVSDSKTKNYYPLPTEEDIYNEILFSQRVAIATARKLGIITGKN